MKWWLNGELVDHDQVNCSVNTYSLHYGICVFEGMRAYDIAGKPVVFRLEEHIERFFRSVRLLGSEITGYDQTQIENAVHQVIGANNVTHLYIRPMYYLGNGIMGIHTKDPDQNLAILVWDWETDHSAPKYQKGIHVQISRHIRHKEYAQAKASGNYLASVAASNTLRGTNFDEAILLDEDGYLCEATAQNLFLVKDGALHTPLIKACLKGVTRNAIIEIARDSGIAVHERDILPAELLCADEAFLTSTASEVLPIRAVDSQNLAPLHDDSITRNLFRKFHSLVHAGPR